MSNGITPITTQDVVSRVITVRGQQVILDYDVAELYGVETKHINEAVRNNMEKFPLEYIMRLANEESSVLRSNKSSLEKCAGKGYCSKYNCIVFTERGLYMLATILKSPRATQTTLTIIDTFVEN